MLPRETADKILRQLYELLRNPYVNNTTIFHTIKKFIDSLVSEDEEHGLSRIEVAYCDCRNCVAMRKEIAKRMIEKAINIIADNKTFSWHKDNVYAREVIVWLDKEGK